MFFDIRKMLNFYIALRTDSVLEEYVCTSSLGIKTYKSPFSDKKKLVDKT